MSEPSPSAEFGLEDDQAISDDHLVQSCQYRQGSACCRYIIYFQSKNKFYCVKKNIDLKDKINQYAAQLKAKGDNCDGLPYEKK